MTRHTYLSVGIGQCGACGGQRGGWIHNQVIPLPTAASPNNKRRYDSTVARMAGNIAAGMVSQDSGGWHEKHIAESAVRIARLILGFTIATEPVEESK